MNRIATVVSWAYHSTALFCVVVMLGLACAGGAWLWKSGWIEKFTPAPPTVEPLKVRLHGSPVLVRGVAQIYVAEVAGPAGKPEWRTLPANAGTLRLLTVDGRIAEFSTLQEGTVTIAVMVAGQGMQIAADQLDAEIVDLEDSEPSGPMPEPPPAANVPPPLPTVGDLASGALANVESHDRAAEARILAGCFMSVIGRARTGLIPPEADVMAEIETEAAAALGDRFGNWHSFLVAVNLILDSLRQQGQITTAASTIPALSEVAAVLQKAQ